MYIFIFTPIWVLSVFVCIASSVAWNKLEINSQYRWKSIVTLFEHCIVTNIILKFDWYSYTIYHLVIFIYLFFLFTRILNSDATVKYIRNGQKGSCKFKKNKNEEIEQYIYYWIIYVKNKQSCYYSTNIRNPNSNRALAPFLFHCRWRVLSYRNSLPTLYYLSPPSVIMIAQPSPFSCKFFFYPQMLRLNFEPHTQPPPTPTPPVDI